MMMVSIVIIGIPVNDTETRVAPTGADPKHGVLKRLSA